MNEAFPAKLRIFDGHNDTLTRFFYPAQGPGVFTPHTASPEKGAASAADAEPFLTRQSDGHLDLVRAAEGGMCGGLYAVFTEDPVSGEWGEYTPPAFERDKPSIDPPLEHALAFKTTLHVLSRLFACQRRHPQAFNIASTAQELDEGLESGRQTLVLHLEGAEAIDRDFINLEIFYRLGVRSLGLTWSRPNIFGNGVPFWFPHSPDTGAGLTWIGKELVRRCHRMGIMVDLAHLNEKGFWDVAELSAQAGRPLVVSHTAAFALSNCSRNLTDKQLQEVARSGGLAGVTFHTPDLHPAGLRTPDLPLTVLAAHIKYMTELMGSEHVALGSDFDGALMPRELADASHLPLLVEALIAQGIQGEALENILWRNWVRVLRASWKTL